MDGEPAGGDLRVLAGRYGVAVVEAQHRLPFRIREFLDDAYRLGLLRIVGAVHVSFGTPSCRATLY
jgi:hypothetical protein